MGNEYPAGRDPIKTEKGQVICVRQSVLYGDQCRQRMSCHESRDLFGISFFKNVGYVHDAL